MLRVALRTCKVASFSDPDARRGFKSKKEPFLAYKAHATCDENGIVTVVSTETANEAELRQLGSLIDKTEDVGIEPVSLTADKGYDSDTVRRSITQKRIGPYIA